MERGEYLKKVMEKKGYNARSLSKDSGVPYTTIRSMIERNLHNASIDNVIKICRTLGISVEDLEKRNFNNEVETIAAHHDGEDWTEEELDEIERFKNFVKLKRNKEL